MTMEEFDQTHQVNLRSIISLSLLALPHLTKTKGNIVNVSSVAGWIPVRNLSINICDFRLYVITIDNWFNGLQYCQGWTGYVYEVVSFP